MWGTLGLVLVGGLSGVLADASVLRQVRREAGVHLRRRTDEGPADNDQADEDGNEKIIIIFTIVLRFCSTLVAMAFMKTLSMLSQHVRRCGLEEVVMDAVAVKEDVVVGVVQDLFGTTVTFSMNNSGEVVREIVGDS